MSGPPPKNPAQRRRRNATQGFEQLDPDGRVAPAPDWPLGDPTKAEQRKWEQIWRLPQATKWEQMHVEDLVALYVRAFISVSEDMDPKLMNEVRQLDNKLGISPLAMRNMRWELAERFEESVEAPGSRASRVYVPGTN